MTKITAKVRATVRQIVADSREFDADTVRIGRDGSVSALKAANKTFAGDNGTRFLVGYVADMVTVDGARQEGW